MYGHKIKNLVVTKCNTAKKIIKKSSMGLAKIGAHFVLYGLDDVINGNFQSTAPFLKKCDLHALNNNIRL